MPPCLYDQIPASPLVRPPKVYRLAVVGTGYVGTVVAACFAHLGYEVTGIETDTAKLARLQVGQIPFHEPGLEDLVTSCLRARAAPLHGGLCGRTHRRRCGLLVRRDASTPRRPRRYVSDE